MTANAAFGTTVGVNGGTVVAQVRTISGPGLSADTIETSSHQSTDGYRTFVQGMKDGGEVSMDLLFDPVGTTHKNAAGGLLYLYEQGTVSTWEVTFSDSGTTTWSFPGIVTGFEPSAPFDGELSASVTIKVAGKPTLA